MWGDYRTYRSFQEWVEVSSAEELASLNRGPRFFRLKPIKEQLGRTPERIDVERASRKSRRQQVKASKKRNRRQG